MAKQEKMDRHLRCSFCGKSRDEVRKLIAGPTVYICDECVNLCNDIIAEDWEEAKEEISSKLKKPAKSNIILISMSSGRIGPKKFSPSPFTIITSAFRPRKKTSTMSNSRRATS